MRGTLAIPTMAASNSGEVALMAVAAEVTNVAATLVLWLNGEVDKQKGTIVELQQWQRGEEVRACAGYGNGGGLRCCFGAAGEQRRRRRSKMEMGACGALGRV